MSGISINGGNPVTPTSGIVGLGGLTTVVKVGSTSYNVSSAGVISLPAYPSTSGFVTGISFNGGNPVTPTSGIVGLGGLTTVVKVGSTSYNVSSAGVISLPAYPTTLPASDVYAWAKASTKPSYTLDEISDGSTRKLADYVTLTTAQTITGLKTMTHGLVVSGRVHSAGDDEGIIITPASNGYSGLILGTHNGRRSVFYLTGSGNPFWKYTEANGNSYNISHPAKSGTIALTSDIPSTANYLPLTGGSINGNVSISNTLTSTTVKGSAAVIAGSYLTVGSSSVNQSYNMYVNGTSRLANLVVANGTQSTVSCVTLTTQSNYGIYVNTDSAPAYTKVGWSTVSDVRRKDIVRYVGASIEQIASAPIFDFKWKEDGASGRQMLGTSAQHWQSVFPCAVSDFGILSLDYGATALAAAVVTARKVQDHEERILELERENERLRKELEELKAA